MRSTNNISLKKPVKSVRIVWDNSLEIRYSDRFRQYLNMVIDECNLLDLEIVQKEDINVVKTIVPIKALFFKKYGKAVQPIYDDLIKWDSGKLDNFINGGGIYKFTHKDEGSCDELKFDSPMFNYSYSIQSDKFVIGENIIFKEFDFGEFRDKILLLMDKSWDTSTDKIYYWRLIATTIQKARKEAGLHPWDAIVVLWEGEPKYSIQSLEALDYIFKITRVELMALGSNYNPDIIYSNYYEGIGLKIHLSK